MTCRHTGVLAGVIAALTLAGCAGPSEIPPAASAPATPKLPARPAELPLTGVDPCALLAAGQQSELGIRGGGELRTDIDQFGSSGCSWGTERAVPPHGSSLVKLITEVPAATYLQNANPSTVIDIDGFPAVQTTGGGDPLNHCLVLVDVAEGQTLWTQYDLAINRQLPTEQICISARRYAQLMLANLRAQLKR